MEIGEFRKQFMEQLRFDAEHEGSAPEAQFISRALELLEDIGDVSDPISLGLNKLQEYLINKPRKAANAYMDNVDAGLAAKWMQSYKGNR